MSAVTQRQTFPVPRMPCEPLSIGAYHPAAGSPQTPADVGVVMPTVIRREMILALRSVFSQEFAGSVQVLIGVDKARGEPEWLERALGTRPAHVSVLVLHLPYSTSHRHGGVHGPYDGGALRALLSYTANSRYVAYLDDDNLWTPNHLALLHEAVKDKVWAFSRRLLIDEVTGAEIGPDVWDSVGPDQGRLASTGGFVDTNCLLVDKVKAASLFGLWAESENGRPGLHADRNFFRGLKSHAHASVPDATVRYFIRRTNVLWKHIRESRARVSGEPSPDVQA